MGYREARQLARLRHELRDRLLKHRAEGSAAVLDQFLTAAEQQEGIAPELRGEYERWKVRFELLTHRTPKASN